MLVLILGFATLLVMGVSTEIESDNGEVELTITPTVADNATISIARANAEACSDGFVDAATRTQDGSTYLFRGDYYWKIDGGILPGYPRLIKDDWKGIESGPIDAAFTWNDGSTFIFKGDSYWRYYNKRADAGYPRKIADGFRGIPNNVDAALVWQNNGLTYFFKGFQYWRYEPNAAVPTHGDYPAPISNWRGVPSNLSAAIRWQGGATYFFKGKQYYRYENDRDYVKSDYPIATGEAWFECAKNRNQNTGNFERERHRPCPFKDSDNEIVSSINELKTSIEKSSTIQMDMQMDIKTLKREMKYLNSKKEV